MMKNSESYKDMMKTDEIPENYENDRRIMKIMKMNDNDYEES